MRRDGIKNRRDVNFSRQLRTSTSNTRRRAELRWLLLLGISFYLSRSYSADWSIAILTCLFFFDVEKGPITYARQNPILSVWSVYLG